MKKEVLIFGAGKSTQFLLNYLTAYSKKNDCLIYLADKDEQLLFEKTKGTKIKPVLLDIENDEKCKEIISGKSLVVSMLPANKHLKIAETCLSEKVHLLTASYISDEIKNLHKQAQKNGLIFLNELGVDPGLDHLSAMQALDELRQDGKRFQFVRTPKL